MTEVDEAAQIISEAADADANIIFGAAIDEKLVDQMRITVIATGFDETRSRLANMVTRNRPVARGNVIATGIVGEKPQTDSFQPRSKPVFNPQPQPQTQVPTQTPPASTQQDDLPADTTDDNSDWDIPAFLRQRK
jgi:cell division protein FtsZ